MYIINRNRYSKQFFGSRNNLNIILRNCFSNFLQIYYEVTLQLFDKENLYNRKIIIPILYCFFQFVNSLRTWKNIYFYGFQNRRSKVLLFFSSLGFLSTQIFQLLVCLYIYTYTTPCRKYLYNLEQYILWKK